MRILFLVSILFINFQALVSENQFQELRYSSIYSFNNKLLKPCSLPPSDREEFYGNTFYLSDEVVLYIDEILSLFQQHSMNRNKFDWDDFKFCFYNSLNYCAFTWQTYPKLKWMVSWLNDNHSHFSTPVESEAMFSTEYDCIENIKGEILENNVAYLKVPHTNCSSGEYASKMRLIIRELDKSHPSFWIIDLRGNWGGDCWEMFEGVSPLFTEGTCGFFGNDDNKNLDQWVYLPGKIIFKNGRGEKTLRVWNDSAPISTKINRIAILIDNMTVSAGESVAIAFRGNSNVKFFGSKTHGATSGIALCTLSDGALLGIASCYDFDRNKENYPDGIYPDFEVLSTLPEDCLIEAIKWLEYPQINPVDVPHM